MKQSFPLYLVAVSFLLTQVPPALGQGPLTPPGPPAPQGRTLEQIEPRVPLSAATSTITITQPGSYYLTGNIAVTENNGIVVSSDNVTLDLNGFTISSTVASPSGVGVLIGTGRVHVTISNGHIRGTTLYTGGLGGGSFSGGGFLAGIRALGSTSHGLRVTNVTVSGVGGQGIDLGPIQSNSVSSSSVHTAASLGIRAGTVADSAALQIGGTTAIDAGTVANSVGALVSGAGTPVVSAQATLPSVAAQLATTQGTVSTLERRTVIPGGTAPFVITQPGSYVLGGNLTVAFGSAITVQANEVMLDLNGFTLVSSVVSPAAGDGVRIESDRNVTVRNGFVRGGTTLTGTSFSGGGFDCGIQAVNSPVSNLLVENVSVSNVRTGVRLGFVIGNTGSVVRNCRVSVAAVLGITAMSVLDSNVGDCGTAGIRGWVVANCMADTLGDGISGDVITNSYGFSSGTGASMSAISARSSVDNCYGWILGAGTGIFSQVATNSRGESNSGLGMNVIKNATNCSGTSNSSTGLLADTATHCTGSTVSGVALKAAIGVSCRATINAGGSGSDFQITNRYLMP